MVVSIAAGDIVCRQCQDKGEARIFARSDFTVTICRDSNHSPEIFPFAYDTLEYVSKEFVNEGILNDAVPQITTPYSKSGSLYGR